MNTTDTQAAHIEGCPRDKWHDVEAIQTSPFIWVQHCGSHCAGAAQNSVADLLRMLFTHKLRKYKPRPIYRAAIAEECDFYCVDPCRGIRNPDFQPWVDNPNTTPQFIDGERLYHVNGVVRFYGNFENYSFGFGIDTNDESTKAALITAIRWNLTNWDTLK